MLRADAGIQLVGRRSVTISALQALFSPEAFPLDLIKNRAVLHR